MCPPTPLMKVIAVILSEYLFGDVLLQSTKLLGRLHHFADLYSGGFLPEGAADGFLLDFSEPWSLCLLSLQL